MSAIDERIADFVLIDNADHYERIVTDINRCVNVLEWSEN